MLDNSSTMKHVWEAFSTLSDAQELISMGNTNGANETINHAKRHLSRIFEQDQNLLRGVMLNTSLDFGCELEERIA